VSENKLKVDNNKINKGKKKRKCAYAKSFYYYRVKRKIREFLFEGKKKKKCKTTCTTEIY